MIEKISPDVLVSPDGDIVGPDDFETITDRDVSRMMENSGRIARMGSRTDIVEEFTDAQRNGDFSGRNECLVAVAEGIGKARQAHAAARSIDGGRCIRGFKSSEHADSLAAEYDAHAKRALVKACASCALSAYCPSNDITSSLEDATVRARFVRRIRNENNLLCEDNLRPGRVKSVQ